MNSSQNKKTIVWIHGITCNGNSHSFFNYENMKNFAKNFEIIYHPLLLTKYDFLSLLESEIKYDYLIIEGSFAKDIDIIERFGFSFEYIVDKLSDRASHIICAGSCASFGGIFRLRDSEKITGGLFSGEEKGGFWEKNDKVINVPGCPLHPKWLANTLFMLKDNKKISLDELSRPKEIFSYFTHHGCVKNEYFEWKVDVKQLGEKEGCLFYKHGCRGPMTHANCNIILWNEVSSKTKVGSPCLGCTEPGFPMENMYETKKYMSLPPTPTGINKRAYYTLAGVAKSFKIDRLEKKLIDDN